MRLTLLRGCRSFSNCPAARLFLPISTQFIGPILIQQPQPPPRISAIPGGGSTDWLAEHQHLWVELHEHHAGGPAEAELGAEVLLGAMGGHVDALHAHVP